MAENDLQVGQFVPTSYVWDMAQLQSTDVTKPEFKELLIRLYQNVNNIALSLNVKDSARYHTEEFVNGQVFFPNPALNSSTESKPEERQVFRKVINFGALPNTAVKNVAHGLDINAGYSFTRIYGAASKPTLPYEYIPLPYSSATLVDNIELSVDATNVIIETAADWSAYTVSYVVLEYLKS